MHLRHAGCNCASILHCFRVTASYLLKVANFNLPHLHLVPSLGVIYSNFTEIFGIRKLESPGYHMVLLHDPQFSHVDIIPACDRQTYTHSDR